jgi:nitrogen fixation protein FixH
MTTISKNVIAKAREQFGTREGSNREAVLAHLFASKGKAVNLNAVTKAVYKKVDEANRNKVKMTIVGLNIMIKEGKLPFKPVAYEGRGEEATFGLFPKSKKA